MLGSHYQYKSAKDYYTGRIIGDVISLTRGIKEMWTGCKMLIAAVTGGGAFTFATEGVGISLAISAAGASTLVISHGAGVVINSFKSLNNDIESYNKNIKDKGNSETGRSKHAEQRAKEGRPVGAARGDAQNVKRSDVLVQDDGRWIVKGDNGRISVFESNGEHVTTFKNPSKNTEMRIKDGRWS